MVYLKGIVMIDRIVFLNGVCHKCGDMVGRLTKKDDSTNTKLSCYKCGAYIKFVGKNEVFKDVDGPKEQNPLDISDLGTIAFQLDVMMHTIAELQNDVKIILGILTNE